MGNHYQKPPITEAIIDIHISRATAVTLKELQAVADKLEADFPTRRDRRVYHGTIQFSGPDSTPSTTASDSQDGFLLLDSNQKRIFQPRLDGCSYSLLAPYSKWEDICSNAQKYWALYRSAIVPTAITRVAVRYVNRIDIPLPIRDFRDFLRTYPELSSDMDPGVSGYFMQLQCPQEEVDALAILTQGMIPPPSPSVLSILLDIDLFRSQNLPNDEEALWQLFESLRLQKNRIFEACITDRTRRLFVDDAHNN